MRRHTGTGTRVIIDLRLAIGAPQHHNETVASHQALLIREASPRTTFFQAGVFASLLHLQKCPREDKNPNRQADAHMPQLLAH